MSCLSRWDQELFSPLFVSERRFLGVFFFACFLEGDFGCLEHGAIIQVLAAAGKLLILLFWVPQYLA